MVVILGITVTLEILTSTTAITGISSLDPHPLYVRLQEIGMIADRHAEKVITYIHYDGNQYLLYYNKMASPNP